MHTNHLRTHTNGFGLYHLTLAFLLGAAIATTLVISLALTAPAHAEGEFHPGVRVPTRLVVLEPADHPVNRVHVVYAERVGPGHGNLYFEYNDGTAGRATPCRVEDSTYCWWDGQRRGNGRGHGVLNFGEGVHLKVRNALLNRGLAS